MTPEARRQLAHTYVRERIAAAERTRLAEATAPAPRRRQPSLVKPLRSFARAVLSAAEPPPPWRPAT